MRVTDGIREAPVAGQHQRHENPRLDHGQHATRIELMQARRDEFHSMTAAELTQVLARLGEMNGQFMAARWKYLAVLWSILGVTALGGAGLAVACVHVFFTSTFNRYSAMAVVLLVTNVACVVEYALLRNFAPSGGLRTLDVAPAPGPGQSARLDRFDIRTSDVRDVF